MNVRKRSGAMGELTTRQSRTGESVANVVAPRGRFASGNTAKSIDNSVAVNPKATGPSKVEGAVSWPGKFSY